MRTGWTLHHYGGQSALYVYVLPPGSAEPVRLSCAGLGPGHHRGLRDLLRGEDVPAELLRALAALNGRKLVPASAAEPLESLLDLLGKSEDPGQLLK